MRSLKQRLAKPVSALRITVICVLGFCIAPIGDWGHVVSGTTEYLWYPEPHIGRSAWWFPVTLIGAVLAATLVRAWLSPRLADDFHRFGLREAIGSVAGVLVVYAASSLLRNSNVEIATIALTAGALLIWSVVDGTLVGFLVGLLVAALAVCGEIVLVELGAFRYLPGADELAGVAPWLPALHFTFGVSIAVIDRAILSGANRDTDSAERVAAS